MSLNFGKQFRTKGENTVVWKLSWSVNAGDGAMGWQCEGCWARGRNGTVEQARAHARQCTAK